MGSQAEQDGPAIWSISMVEEALIACHELWRRSPGAGGWPFAGDGPWHLIQAERGDFAGNMSEDILTTSQGTEMKVLVQDSPPPRTPLNTHEVGERDRVTAWLQWLDDPLERRILHHCTRALWQGEDRVPWRRLKRIIGWSKSEDALAWRYRKGCAEIACRLNGWPGWPSARARKLASGG